MALPKVFEFGHFCGHTLRMLEQVISEIYLPLVSVQHEVTLEDSDEAVGATRATTGTEDPRNATAKSVGLSDTAKNELIITMQKFASQINHTMQQVAGEVRLKVPIVSTNDPAKAAKDPNLVRSLTTSAQEWVEIMVGTINKELVKQPVGNGPLAEIEFWRDRNASLSTIYEQINQPNFQLIVRILNQAQVANAATLEFQMAEITKYYLEANDNVKFLSTLERHFKNIVIGSSQSVTESMPSLLNAIRMVWIISRHYNRDERMVPLMARIAWEMANKVTHVVNVKTVFRSSLAVSKKTISDAKTLLDSWSKTYFQVRERIEQSGRDQRWEFDRKKLFEQTNYMALRLADLFEVAEVMEQFYSIFGPELKAVTGDPQQIDEVIKRVEQLVVPIEQAPFDIFNKK